MGFLDLIKAYSEEKEKSGGGEEKSSGDSPGKPSKPPRTVYEIIASAGEKGMTFNEVVRMYSEASGLKSRKVNRTTIRYSLDKMVESGKLKSYNKDGSTVYCVA